MVDVIVQIRMNKTFGQNIHYRCNHHYHQGCQFYLF